MIAAALFALGCSLVAYALGNACGYRRAIHARKRSQTFPEIDFDSATSQSQSGLTPLARRRTPTVQLRRMP